MLLILGLLFLLGAVVLFTLFRGAAFSSRRITDRRRDPEDDE